MRLALLREQLGGKPLCLGNSLNLDRDRIHRLLQLVEALLELQQVRQPGRRGLFLYSTNEPPGNGGERCSHSYDDRRDYGKVCDVRIHGDLGKKLSAFSIAYLRCDRALVSMSLIKPQEL